MEILSFLHQFTGSIVSQNVVDREAEMFMCLDAKKSQNTLKRERKVMEQ